MAIEPKGARVIAVLQRSEERRNAGAHLPLHFGSAVLTL